MANPFDEIEIKKDSTVLHTSKEAQLPVPAQSDQVEPVLSSDLHAGGGLAFDHRVAAIDSAAKPILPADLPPAKRSKKYFKIAGLMLGLAPLALVSTVILLTPGSVPFLKGRYFDRTNAERIADYTASINANRQMSLVLQRANLYGEEEQWDKEIEDYEILLKNKVNLPGGDVWVRVAAARIAASGVTEANSKLLWTAVKKASAHSELSADPGTYYSGDSALFSAYYALFLCNDQQAKSKIAAMTNKTAPVNDAELFFLKALLARSQGDARQSKSLINKINAKYYAGTYFGSQVYCFKALMALDRSDAAAAASIMAAYKKEIAGKKEAESYVWLLQSTEAWTLYEQGKYKEALQKCDQSTFRLHKDLISVARIHGGAANMLLKAHILLKLGRDAEANRLFADYKVKKLDGSPFIPQVFRSWTRAQ